MKSDERVTVTRFSIPAPIPEDLQLAFVSDLHGYDNGPVLDAIAAVAPDAVLVGGDMIHDKNRYREGLEFLSRSSERWPTFCSIGNHELRYRNGLRRILRSTGASLLDNEAVDFRGIRLGGLTSALLEQHNLSRLIKKQVPDLVWLQEFSSLQGFKLLLCHHPEYYDRYIRHLPIDLTLSGHAHGGQWRVRGRGLFAVGQGLLPKYSAGLYDGDRLLVSRGIGNAHPLVPRINNLPEVVSLRLVSGN